MENQATQLLLIEDEKAFAVLLESYLQQHGNHVTTRYSLQGGIEQTLLKEFDCIIVDIGLPDGSGLELIRRVKSRRLTSSLIIISARNTLEDKIIGLDLGADDYLIKPFDLPELNARLKSVMRRRYAQQDAPLIFDKLVLYPATGQVKVDQRPLLLTQKEYELLFFFMTNPDQLLDKLTIAKQVWGYNMDLASNDILYTHMRNIRKKFVDAGCPEYIHTRYGLGYILTMA
ncbi:MAG: DNA-binding response regulator [Dyadobacter sp. 50-39]|uniref:response regulator transcription factor n=1 Tax=Dyadobacter sp. 50-39 TaxID=1895756 RepID=UPI0009659DAC|nr:response regulator transcription factor [Dyadobacter sp. 50-39]OJV22572.1 MAG: DNA-binding response regulator [Dyadobacter sp. 50-39]